MLELRKHSGKHIKSGISNKFMTLLALIPARGGSKGIPKKNIRSFCGKPLIYWTIQAALQSKYIDRVVVSTDDPEIAQISKECGADVPFLRPRELANDTAPGIAPVLHALDKMEEVEDVLLLQPTSPLRMSIDIEGIIEYRNKNGARSAVSIALSQKHPALMYYLENSMRLKGVVQETVLSCRQDYRPVYVLNGALYLARRDFIQNEQTLLSDDTLGYEMPVERSVDIDTIHDWDYAEFLMNLREK